jgi:hypothetical protein
VNAKRIPTLREIITIYEAIMEVRACGEQAITRCPVHPETGSDLWVTRDATGRVRLACRAECPEERLLALLRLPT